ncbi:DUF2651 family protein [Metabacillus fastidiosus]|uniref:DUF2651 family protein n=1 Tax=Metabacillus fastidiosus TaxID=1458 RepID=UPI003D2CD0E1
MESLLTYNSVIIPKEGGGNLEIVLLLFTIFPIIVILASIIGYLLIKKWFVIPLLTSVVFTILTFTIFNESFFIWTVLYTILSLIMSLIMKFSKK